MYLLVLCLNGLCATVALNAAVPVCSCTQNAAVPVYSCTQNAAVPVCSCTQNAAVPVCSCTQNAAVPVCSCTQNAYKMQLTCFRTARFYSFYFLNLQSFGWLAAFYLELLQATLFPAVQLSAALFLATCFKHSSQDLPTAPFPDIVPSRMFTASSLCLIIRPIHK
jgi:hypothetical protein